MKISDLTELQTVDGYMPVDVAGDTKKIDAELLAPDIANNLTTTSTGYVLDARQGKALNDQIQTNAATIASMDSTVESGMVFKSKPWSLYASRANNTAALNFPSDANEIMIVAWENSIEEYFTGIYIPGMISDAMQMLLGGYYQGTTWTSARFARITTTITPSSNTVGTIAGYIKPTTSADSAVQITTSSDWSTQIWYR